MEPERRDTASYTRRRLAAFAVLAAILLVALFVWWRVAAWITARVIGDGASVWISFLGIPLFVAYVVYRVYEEIRDE